MPTTAGRKLANKHSCDTNVSAENIWHLLKVLPLLLSLLIQLTVANFQDLDYKRTKYDQFKEC